MPKHRLVKGLAVAAGIASAAWAARTVARSITGAVPEGGVNESMYVNIGGVRQWISIYGKDLNNPVLLFLHGGPGGALSTEGWAVLNKIGDVFTIVNWDQRNCGKSRSRDQDDIPITAELIMSDAVELTNYIRGRFGRDRITLCGISWGSYLGSNLALAHPELYDAWIPMSLLVDWRESEVYIKNKGLLLAEERGDEKLRAAAEKFDPEGEDRENGLLRAVLIDAVLKERITDGDFSLAWALFASPYSSVAEIIKSFTPLAYPPKDLLKGFFSSEGFEAMSLKGRTEYKIPFYLIDGDHDGNCPYDIAKQYYDEVQAPDKALYIRENGGHMSPMLRTEEFSANLHDIAARMRRLGIIRD
ncbi:MAG: alpha/beta hydrolase [Firmicutes bacterium]|nr:alpha/beta hydrolase [Bacillota bacterium]